MALGLGEEGHKWGCEKERKEEGRGIREKKSPETLCAPIDLEISDILLF
jgi:hypothetical protein